MTIYSTRIILCNALPFFAMNVSSIRCDWISQRYVHESHGKALMWFNSPPFHLYYSNWHYNTVPIVQTITFIHFQKDDSNRHTMCTCAYINTLSNVKHTCVWYCTIFGVFVCEHNAKKKQHKDIVTFFSESSNTQWIGFIDCLLFAYYINKYLKCTYKVIQAAQSRGKSLAKVIYKHFFRMQLYFYAFSLTCRYFKSKHLTKQFLLDVNIIFDLLSPLSTAQTQYRFESYTMYCILYTHILNSSGQ